MVFQCVDVYKRQHLYQALSPEGHAVLIREFCPGGLVTRDLASGELAVFPENESQFAQAREAFETQYAANAESKLRGFGTVLFLYPLSPAQPDVYKRQVPEDLFPRQGE